MVSYTKEREQWIIHVVNAYVNVIVVWMNVLIVLMMYVQYVNVVK